MQSVSEAPIAIMDDLETDALPTFPSSFLSHLARGTAARRPEQQHRRKLERLLFALAILQRLYDKFHSGLLGEAFFFHKGVAHLSHPPASFALITNAKVPPRNFAQIVVSFFWRTADLIRGIVMM